MDLNNISKNEYLHIVDKPRGSGDPAVFVFEEILSQEDVTVTSPFFEVNRDDSISAQDAVIMDNGNLSASVYDTIVSIDTPSIGPDLQISVLDIASYFSDVLYWDNWDTPWDSCLTPWDDLFAIPGGEYVNIIRDLGITLTATGEIVESECLPANFSAVQTLSSVTGGAIAQSYFSGGGRLLNMSFLLSKKGVVTGQLQAEIYLAVGTYGVSNVPLTLLAVSSPVDVSTLTDQYDGSISSCQEVLFDFTANNYSFVMDEDTYYCAVIRYNP